MLTESHKDISNNLTWRSSTNLTELKRELFDLYTRIEHLIPVKFIDINFIVSEFFSPQFRLKLMLTTMNRVIIRVTRVDQTVHVLESPTFVKSFVHARKTAETDLRAATASPIVRQRV